MQIKYPVKGQKKWEGQGCEVLSDAKEALVTQMIASQRSAPQCSVKRSSRHQKSAETTQAAMLIWLG